VGSARLICGHYLAQSSFAQLSLKREDVTGRYSRFGLVLLVLLDGQAGRGGVGGPGAGARAVVRVDR
jgi:hypothetical protein